MLDSYIKIDDIKKLLDETVSINGLIKKSDFQKAITMIEEFRKPEIKPKNRIKNRLHLISMIDSYKKNILDKKVKPEIIIYMERLTNMNFSNRRIELFKTDHWGEGDENERIDISDIVLDGKTFTLKTGESIVFPANAPHALTAVEKFKMLLTMIKG